MGGAVARAVARVVEECQPERDKFKVRGQVRSPLERLLYQRPGRERRATEYEDCVICRVLFIECPAGVEKTQHHS